MGNPSLICELIIQRTVKIVNPSRIKLDGKALGWYCIGAEKIEGKKM